MLNHAAKVMLFCGAGCRDAHDEVMRLAEALKAPVGHSLGGKEWIQYDNPYDVGMRVGGGDAMAPLTSFMTSVVSVRQT